jgi:hypothetical protein
MAMIGVTMSSEAEIRPVRPTMSEGSLQLSLLIVFTTSARIARYEARRPGDRAAKGRLHRLATDRVT